MIKYLLVSLFLASYVKSQTLSFFSNSLNVTYTVGQTQTQFTVSSTLDPSVSISNAWIAVGFNSIQKMDGTNAVICKNNRNVTTVENIRLTGYNAPALLSSASPSLGLSGGSVTLSGNRLTCTFTRDNSNPATGYFNILASQPYIIVAYGVLLNGAPQYHSNKAFTSNTVAFIPATTTPTTSTTRISTTTTVPSTTTTIRPSTTTTTIRPSTTTTTIRPSTTTPLTLTTTRVSSSSTTMTTTKTTTKSPANSTVYGSFSAPGFLLEWTNGPLFTDFKFSHNLTSATRKRRDISVVGTGNIYIAFGLSNDDEMGDDCVCACRIFNNIGVIEHYYNDPNANAAVILNSNNRSIGISNQIITFDNNTLRCSFRRVKSIQGEPKYFDLNKNYYILMANGASTQTGLTYHWQNHLESDSIIDFQNNGTYTSSGESNSIVQNIINIIQSVFSAIYNFFQNLKFF